MTEIASGGSRLETVAQIETILREVADGISVQAPDGTLVYVNEAAARQMGFPSPEVLLATPLTEVMQRFEVLDEEGRPFPLERMPGRRALLGETDAEELVCWRVRATGEEHWSIVRATPVFEDGRVRFAINVFQDITPRKRAEDAIRLIAEASELLGDSLDYARTLRRLAEVSVPRLADWCMVYVAAPEGRIERLAVQHAGGLHTGVLEQLRDYEFDPDATTGVPHVIRTGQAILEPDATSAMVAADVRGAEQLARELDSLGICSWMCLPLTARGRTLGALSLLAAESKRRFDRADLELAAELARRSALAIDNARLYEEARTSARESADSFALLEGLLASAPIGIGFWDTELRYVRVNDALAEINGLPADEHVGKTLAEVIPHLAPTLEPLYRRVLETGEPYIHLEFTGETPAEPGEVRHWLTSYYPVRDADGAIVGMGAVITEITERKQAELALQAGEARLAFLAEASRLLASSLDYEATLRQVTALAVPELADVCTVDVVHDGVVERLAVAHADPERTELVWNVSPSDRRQLGDRMGPGAVIATGESELVVELTDEMLVASARDDEHLERLRGLALVSYVCVPLRAGGEILGALTLYTAESGRRFGESDLAFIEEVGRRAAVAILNARLHAATRAAAREAEETAALLDTILRTAPVGFAFYDRDLRYVRINEAMAEINGRPVAEHLGRTVHEVLPRLGPELVDDFRHVLATGEPILDREVSGETPAAPGVTRHWLCSYYPIGVAPGGEPVGLGVIASEITARKRAEESRRLAEQRLELLAEASRVLAASLDYETTLQNVVELSVPRLADWSGVYLLGAGGRLEQVAVAHRNPRQVALVREVWERWGRTPPSEHAFGRVMRAREAVLVRVLDEKRLRKHAVDEEHLARLRDLGMRSAMIAPLVVGGRSLGVISFIRTAGRAAYDDAELALADELARRAATAIENARLFGEAEERAQAALALTFVADGVALVDRHGVVRLWNPAAEAITGISRDEVLDRPTDDAIPGWSELAARVPIASSSETRAAVETLPLELEGREIWLSISGVGFEEGTVFAFRDMTAERNVEQLKSDFVATISHELRTPLAAIYGAAVTLRRGDLNLEAQLRHQLLGVVASEADRLARIVNDILWASRVESGTLRVTIESCDPGLLAREVVEAQRAHLPAGITLTLTVPEGLPSVAADPDKIRQVLVNLLDNAVKYSPDGGEVEVSLAASNGRLRFAIRDEGLGIPASEQTYVFEKFYRLDPDLTRGVGGTGLGLYICRELVRHMGGRIAVDSRPGEGSTFTVDLPVAER